MARSKLLTDLVNGSSSLETILLRLKVILTDLEDEKILDWIKGELEGYKETPVPSYRTLRGIPTGTFIVNYQNQYTNARVPLGSTFLTEELIETIITLEYTDSINTIQNLLNSENRNDLKKSIETELCHNISTQQLQILGMTIDYSSNQIDGIVSVVKSKLVDIIMELEKTFDNIDALDISSQIEENPKVTDQIIYNIQSIVFGDSTEVEIGDGNKIKGSKFGKMFGFGK